jgi:hypothetical protein
MRRTIYLLRYKQIVSFVIENTLEYIAILSILN